MSAPLFDTLRRTYLDYVNNYLTVEAFADHHFLRVEQAKNLLEIGKECHEAYCKIHQMES